MPKVIKSSQVPKAKKVGAVGNRKVSGVGASKTKKPKKPTWDSTSSDLNVHKLSKRELEIRHQAHKSKNIEAAKHELYDKAKESFDLNSSGNLRPSPCVSGGSELVKKRMMIQQSLHGRELHSILMESDRSMRVVKDLFGDDPKRYSCQPNVTVAPHIRENRQILEQAISESHVDGPPPTAHASPGGIRDKGVQDIVQRKPALNEFPEFPGASCALSYDGDGSMQGPTHLGNPSEEGEDLEGGGGASYKSGLDLNRFQKLVEETSPPSTSLASSVPHQNYNLPNDQVFRPMVSGKGPQHQIREWNESRDMKGVQYRGVAESVQSDADSNGSVAGMSEFSSIPGDGGRGGNSTVSSDVSGSVYNAYRTAEYAHSSRHGGMDGAHPQEAAVSRQGAALQGSREGLPGQHVALSGHPLHVSHKVPNQQIPKPSSSSGHVRGGVVSDTVAKTAYSAEKIRSDLTNLTGLIEELNRELSTYEIAASHAPVSASSSSSTSHTHSSHSSEVTGPLVDSVQRMMHYLHQSETQLKGEVAIRGQFLQTLNEQQDLMDVLTADLLFLRQENSGLRQDLTASREESREEIAILKGEIAAMHVAIAGMSRHSKPPPKYRHPMSSQNMGRPSSSEKSRTSFKGYLPPTASLASSSNADERGYGKIQPLLSPPDPQLGGHRKIQPPLSPDPQLGGHTKTLPPLSPPDPRQGGHKKTVLFCSPPDLSMDRTDHTSSSPQDAVFASTSEDPFPNPAGQVFGSQASGVVYAQVSPLSYPADRNGARRQSTGLDPGPTPVSGFSTIPVPHSNVTLAFEGVPGPRSKPPTTALLPDTPGSLSTLQNFIGSLHAPAPPPLSVALQVPSYSSALRPPLTSVSANSETAGTAFQRPPATVSALAAATLRPGLSQTGHTALQPSPGQSQVADTAILPPSQSEAPATAFRPSIKQQSNLSLQQSSNSPQELCSNMPQQFSNSPPQQSNNSLQQSRYSQQQSSYNQQQSNSNLQQFSRNSMVVASGSNDPTQAALVASMNSNNATPVVDNYPIQPSSNSRSIPQSSKEQTTLTIVCGSAVPPGHTTTQQPPVGTVRPGSGSGSNADPTAGDKTDFVLTEVTGFDSSNADSTTQGDQLGDPVVRVDDLESKVFDVAKLLDSLQQLNRTQGQLQATAEKLRSLPLMSADSASSQSSNPSDGDAIEPGINIKDDEGSVSTAPVQQMQAKLGDVELSLSGLSSSLSSLPVQQIRLHPPVDQWVGEGPQDKVSFGKGSASRDASFGKGSPGHQGQGTRSSPRLNTKQSSPWGTHGSPPAHKAKMASKSPSAVMKRKVAFDVSVGSQDTSIESDHGISTLSSPQGNTTNMNLGASDKGVSSLEKRRRNGGLGVVRKQRGKELEDKAWFSINSHLA